MIDEGRWHFTLWSRYILAPGVHPGTSRWEQQARHREQRCWDLAEAGNKERPDLEWCVMPPGEKPTADAIAFEENA